MQLAIALELGAVTASKMRSALNAGVEFRAEPGVELKAGPGAGPADRKELLVLIINCHN